MSHDLPKPPQDPTSSNEGSAVEQQEVQVSLTPEERKFLDQGLGALSYAILQIPPDQRDVERLDKVDNLRDKLKKLGQ